MAPCCRRILLLSILVPCFPVLAQSPEQQPPPVAHGPRLAVELEQHMGAYYGSGRVEHHFKISNPGTETLIIDRVRRPS